MDDTEPNRLLLGAIISRLGISVDYAEDGDSAVERFSQTSPDIVIIDQIMPNKNGSDALKQMKLIRQNFTSILMSSLTSSSEIASIMRDCEADEFLTKPISSTQIADVLKKYHHID
ncbi:MAG: response regulator [Bacteroidetes bacterium]|nr:response regulator [Bacteroidota bacterium]